MIYAGKIGPVDFRPEVGTQTERSAIADSKPTVNINIKMKGVETSVIYDKVTPSLSGSLEWNNLECGMEKTLFLGHFVLLTFLSCYACFCVCSELLFLGSIITQFKNVRSIIEFWAGDCCWLFSFERHLDLMTTSALICTNAGISKLEKNWSYFQEYWHDKYRRGIFLCFFGENQQFQRLPFCQGHSWLASTLYYVNSSQNVLGLISAFFHIFRIPSVINSNWCELTSWFNLSERNVIGWIHLEKKLNYSTENVNRLYIRQKWHIQNLFDCLFCWFFLFTLRWLYY